MELNELQFILIEAYEHSKEIQNDVAYKTGWNDAISYPVKRLLHYAANYSHWIKEGKVMDSFKKATSADFTAWDLNAPAIYKPHNRKRTKQQFKRKARRKEKQTFQEIFRKPLDKLDSL